MTNTDADGERLRDAVGWRVKTTAVAWIVVGVGMVLLGMEPRLVLLGFVVLITAAVIWLIRDLAATSSPLAWNNPVFRDHHQEGHDMRVRILRSRLQQTPLERRRRRAANPDGPEREDQIVESLVAVVDQHLLAEHGIDRASDPASASKVLGPELARLLTDDAAQRSMTRRRSLAGTIKLIEDLTASSPPNLAGGRTPHDTA